jgi:HK97 family phage portal protein
MWTADQMRPARRHKREKRAFGDRLADVLEMMRGGRTYAGVPVNDEQAMRLGAVWGCVDLLSELVSTLPVDEYKRATSGELVVQRPHPLLTDPAGDGTGFEVWGRQVMTSLLLRGNAFGLVHSIGFDGWPTRIEVLHPDLVTARRTMKLGPVEWRLDNRPIELWQSGGQLWHLPAYPIPGTPVGMSPIRYAAETIGLGLAVQRFGAQWFGDGAHPSSVIESDQEIDQTQAEVIKKRVKDALHGTREPLVIGAGGRFKPIQVSPDESQFLETIKANADDVARFFFRRPPGEGGQVTYANVEARSLDLLVYTVNGWLVRLERALTRLRPRPRFVKFNADALLRVDLASRYKAHDMGIRAGWLSRNDVRRIEDMPPIADGDEYLWPPYATSLDSGNGPDQPPRPSS